MTFTATGDSFITRRLPDKDHNFQKLSSVIQRGAGHCGFEKAGRHQQLARIVREGNNQNGKDNMKGRSS
jgi:hypothetical protein